MLRWILFSLAGLVLVGALIAVVGWLLPVGHHASRSVTVRASPEEVFRLISDVTAAASWRPDVVRVEAVEGTGPGMRFREVGPNGTVTYRVETFEPGRRLATRIDDRTLPFGGTWRFDLEPVADGTRLTIAEDGEVYNPIFRFLSRFVFSPTATIARYQSAVTKRLDR